MPVGAKRDIPATAMRKFKNKRSFISLDGREILYGADYKRRVREVLERDGYKCQWVVVTTSVSSGLVIKATCLATANNHPHHVIKRSVGRDDRASNLMSICDEHHRIAHPEKQVRWTSKEK